MARIVLATFGSHGDLFPYVAIAERLKQRGHEPVIAAPEVYRPDVESLGIEFAAVRPDVDLDDAETYRKAMDPKRGTVFVVRKILVPSIRESYADLERASDGADLLVSHALTYAAHMLGERGTIPWISTALMPMMFASVYDPPALSPIPWFAKTRALGPGVVGLMWRLLKRAGWSWGEPIRVFRRELGLRADVDPLWDTQFSPQGVLALFSSVIASVQTDWPPATTVCGFPFHDRDFGGDTDADRLGEFLEAGPPPLVFSLGSSAARAAGDFYDVAAAAAARLGRRAVLVTGGVEVSGDRPDALVIRSTALHKLFDRASVVIHAGGIGTTGLALRAGCSQLVVPFAHDQFDNAVRVVRHGVGRRLDRKRLTAGRLTRQLEHILGDEQMSSSATAIGEQVRAEDGTGVACDVLERAALAGQELPAET